MKFLSKKGFLIIYIYIYTYVGIVLVSMYKIYISGNSVNTKTNSGKASLTV